jgi:hypothetical protein
LQLSDAARPLFRQTLARRRSPRPSYAPVRPVRPGRTASFRRFAADDRQILSPQPDRIRRDRSFADAEA